MTTKPHTGVALAFGMPLDTAIQRLHASARELDAAAEKQPGRTETFGQRIKNAVQHKMRSGSHTHLRAEGESFGERLEKAVEKKSGRRQHEQQAERERRRYQQPQPRKRTKGE